MSETIIIKVDSLDKKTRIDKYLEVALQKQGYTYSRTQIQKNIENIRLNGKSIKKNTALSEGDVIEFITPQVQQISLEPEDVPFEIVYNDKDIVVVNKPYGLVVHPAKGNYSGTLVNGLLKRIDDFQPIGDTIRPGIVHRLDKDTSGLMVIAKNDISHQLLIKAFKQREVTKIYHCICIGKVNFKTKTIETNIGRHSHQRKKFAVVENGKYAKTKLEALKYFDKHTLLKIRIYTGRTHQIRVHLSYIKHPIAGDKLYSRSANKYPEGMSLVSKELSFNHPTTGELMHFECDYPEHFMKMLERVGNREK